MPLRSEGEEGQALVEFALVLPVVLLLLLGILQVALVLNARQTVENAARIAADTYARTLSAGAADGEAAAAADRLSPRLLPPAANTAYTVIGERTVTTCVRRFFGCRQFVTTSVRTDRSPTTADPGRRGELVRATIRYDYPLPVGGLARFGFQTHVPLTGEAISLIDATAPATAQTPARTRCYEVVRGFETFGNPIELSATVNGSPSARFHAVPGLDVAIQVVVSPGRALREYSLGDQTVKREVIRLGDGAQTVSSDSSAGWRIGSSVTVSYRYRAAVTLRPASDASCSGAG